MAQQRAQIAELKAESAFSGIGVVADQTRHAQSVVEATIAEAHSVRDEVSSGIAEIAKRADISISSVADVLTGKVQQVAAQFEAHTSHAIEQVAQQLEKDVKAIAMSTAATAETSTRAAVEGIRCEVQAQINQTRTDSQRKEEETRRQVEQIAEGLKTLTEQLNQFKIASEHAVGVSQEKLPDQVQQRFDAQEDRITNLSETVLESQKAAQTNAETLHSLLVSIENLGENVKNMQEEMVAWQSGYQDAEREYKKMNEQLL